MQVLGYIEAVGEVAAIERAVGLDDEKRKCLAVNLRRPIFCKNLRRVGIEAILENQTRLLRLRCNDGWRREYHGKGDATERQVEGIVQERRLAPLNVDAAAAWTASTLAPRPASCVV
jgi:hypothetical protein